MNKHTFIVNDESVNSHGFLVKTDGIDLTRFLQNPVMLYLHDKAMSVIGKWENLRKDGTQLLADAVFDIDDEFAKEIAGKVERGFIKATSLGLVYSQDDFVMNGNEPILQKSILMEISIVPIPSNGNALKLYSGNFESVELKLNQVQKQGSLLSVLKLSGAPSIDVIVDAVKNLKKVSDDLQNELDKIKDGQKNEAENLVALLISKKFLPAHLKNVQLDAFKADFYKAKHEVEKLFPVPGISLSEQLIHAEKVKERKLKLDGKITKPKSEWDLDDYRQFAPKDLEQSPELFKKLLNAKYNTQI